jgi:hypothetical protein
MTNIAARKQARRFFGSMGATMRRSRWLETRPNDRTDATIRRAHGYPENHHAGLTPELMAR